MQQTPPRYHPLAALACMTALVAGCAGYAPKPYERPLTYPPIQEPQPAPAQSGLADLGAVRLAYTDTGGPGEAVVLLHPATGSLRSWPHQQPALYAAGFRVVTYSRRGHAGSDIGDPKQRGTAAGDLAQLLDHLGIQKAHLVGVAAGGIYATDFTLAFPQRVHKLVIANSIVAIGDAAYMQENTALRPKGFDQMPPEFRELGAQYRAGNPAGVRRWLQIEEENAISPATMAQTRQPPINQLTLAALATIRTPTLLITGDADLYTPPAMLARLAAQIPRVQARVLEGSGHSPHWERPDAFNATVIGFLQQKPREAPSAR